MCVESLLKVMPKNQHENKEHASDYKLILKSTLPLEIGVGNLII